MANLEMGWVAKSFDSHTPTECKDKISLIKTSDYGRRNRNQRLRRDAGVCLTVEIDCEVRFRQLART
ncbi:MAG: hypothetical protein IKM57_05930, partial [Paludibacteraceae bacterium]|nr:hypothetical protein [Paludibacteraceae bacterium]